MNILYCGDRNIADGLVLSALSLANHTDEPLHIYVLTMSLVTPEKTYAPVPASLLQFLAQKLQETHPGSTVKCTDVAPLFAREVPEINLDTRFTPFCMLRLFADELPLPDKMLYLDTDVLCRGDFSEFYRQDLSGVEFAGTLDYYGRWFFRRKWYRMDYVNSGVLLLNMKRIRETGLFRRCREMCRTEKMFMPDQSALNRLAQQKRLVPRRYNDQRRLHRDTVFQHFTTSFRFFPWFRVVTVKPWEPEKMHRVLRLHEYDDLLAQWSAFKAAYEAEQASTTTIHGGI